MARVVVAAAAALRGEFSRRDVADAVDVDMVQPPREGRPRQVIVLHQNTALEFGKPDAETRSWTEFSSGLWAVSDQYPISLRGGELLGYPEATLLKMERRLGIADPEQRIW